MTLGRLLVWGLGASGAGAGLWAQFDGQTAGRAALVAGVIAVAVQGAAHKWMHGIPADAPVVAMWRRHLHGTAMRLGGAGLVTALVMQDRESFPPLATITTFAGVLFGLLMLEIRKLA